MKQIILGGGCFWCTEAVFQRLEGVQSVTPGYAGGTTKNPHYYSVAMGDTGHAEVVRVEYDEKVVSLSYLLEIFFKTHDPTTKDRQGADVGSQYRSLILYTDDADLEVIQHAVKEAQMNYPDPIITEVARGESFYEAEPEHKEYYLKNAAQPYCQIVIAPKVEKLSQIIAEKQPQE